MYSTLIFHCILSYTCHHNFIPYFHLHPLSLQEAILAALEETAAVLRGGGVIALPTDTIYGIASLVSSDKGVEKIYNIKGRERGKPLAICVSKVADVYR